MITNQLLYQLSYTGLLRVAAGWPQTKILAKGLSGMQTGEIDSQVIRKVPECGLTMK